MTKLGIISDTHDNQYAIKSAIGIFEHENVEFIFHCGDFIAPFSVKAFIEAQIPLRLCFGNNDGEKRMIRELANSDSNCVLSEVIVLDEIEGKKIAMTHGHFYNVLDIALNSGKFDLVLSGHHHRKKMEILNNGTFHINPGEGGGWLTGVPSLAILDLNTMESVFIDIP